MAHFQDSSDTTDGSCINVSYMLDINMSDGSELKSHHQEGSKFLLGIVEPSFFQVSDKLLSFAEFSTNSSTHTRDVLMWWYFWRAFSHFPPIIPYIDNQSEHSMLPCTFIAICRSYTAN